MAWLIARIYTIPRWSYDGKSESGFANSNVRLLPFPTIRAATLGLRFVPRHAGSGDAIRTFPITFAMRAHSVKLRVAQYMSGICIRTNAAVSYLNVHRPNRSRWMQASRSAHPMGLFRFFLFGTAGKQQLSLVALFSHFTHATKHKF